MEIKIKLSFMNITVKDGKRLSSVAYEVNKMIEKCLYTKYNAY